LYNCLGYKTNETVLIVSDDSLWELGRSFYEGLKSLGIEVIIMGMKTRGIHGEEPPPAVAEAMRQTDIALLITTKSLSHTDARRAASTSERRPRIASLPNADPTRIDRLLNVNYDEMLRHAMALSVLLEKTKQVHLVTKAGTDLVMNIEGRQPHLDVGLLSAPGSFGNLPAGEVYLAPLEGTTNGTLVIDGSMGGLNKLSRPIRMTIENGKAIKIDSDELNHILQPFDESAYQIAELGIGINPNAKVVENILEDEKAINTAHIALGDNLSMGGKNKAPCHLDGVILFPTIKLDGKAISERLVTWYPDRLRKKSLQPVPSDTTYSLLEFEDIRANIGPELYQMLLEKSNDPQYVLDIESQVFLEANPAFLALSGYQREELVGRLKSKDLAPPQVRPVLIKKREAHLKGVMSERYEFQVLTKSGEIKPIELSVHRTKLGGRAVTIGSARDISERLALEKNLREKITEIALAGNRLMALTEKIKNVPTLTSELLSVLDEKTLCEKSIKMLCDPEGLRYKDAAIYLIREGKLALCRCSKVMSHKPDTRLPPKIVDLNGQHRLARFIRGETVSGLTQNEIIVPLKGRQQTIGLITLIIDPKEKELMRANPSAQKGYEDILKTVVATIGLLIENLWLTKTLEIQSVVDELTQVHNRRYFERVLKEEVARARRYRRACSLLLIDLDNFKEINDTAGHKQGDIILNEIAQLLFRNSRQVDATCRYGGDEFAIIMPETNLRGAITKATLLHEKIKSHRFTNLQNRKKPFYVSASFGVSTISEKHQVLSEEALLRTADQALYQAKRLKKNRIKSYCEV